MELAATGEARFYRPDGRPLPEAPVLPDVAREPVTALVARLASHGVAVDGGATLPDWWGGPVDYACAPPEAAQHGLHRCKSRLRPPIRLP